MIWTTPKARTETLAPDNRSRTIDRTGGTFLTRVEEPGQHARNRRSRFLRGKEPAKKENGRYDFTPHD